MPWSSIIVALGFVFCSCAGPGDSKISPSPEIKPNQSLAVREQPQATARTLSPEPEKPSISVTSEPGETTAEKPASPASTPSATPAGSADASARPVAFVPRVWLKDSEVPLQGSPLDVHVATPLTLEYSPTPYWFVFERVENGAYLLNTYPPSAQARRVEITLADFAGDRDWFFLASPQELSAQEKETLAETLSDFTPDATPPHRGLRLARNVQGDEATWKLFTVNPQTTDVRLLAKIRLTTRPFSADLLVKKNGELEFRPFSPQSGSIQKQDELKIKVKIHQKTHFAVFLQDGRGVERLFPDRGTQNVELSTDRDIPSTGGFSVDENAGTEYLWLFYSDQPLSCSVLEQQIKPPPRGTSRSFSTEEEDWEEPTEAKTPPLPASVVIPLRHQ